MDTEMATSSLDKIKSLREGPSVEDVEVVIAHDKGWMEKNESRFFPGKL